MQVDFALALIRHVLQFGGGALIAHGYADDATVQTVVGALMSIVSVVWSQLDKRAVIAGR